MLKLEFIRHKQPSYWVVDEKFEAGQTVKNGLKIEHATVNDRHATFELTDNVLRVTPINLSPVSINEQTIVEPTILGVGDTLCLGDVQIQVTDPALKQRESTPKLFSEPELGVVDAEPKTAAQSWKIKPLDKLVSHLINIDSQLSVGRDPSNDLVVNGNHISRRHARFFIENDQLHIQDLDSSNGTYVNGERVKERSIYLGDKVRFDSSDFLVAVGKPKNALQAEDQDRTQFRPALTPKMLGESPTLDELDTVLLPEEDEHSSTDLSMPIRSVTMAELGAIPAAVVRNPSQEGGAGLSNSMESGSSRTAHSNTTLYLLSFLAVLFLFAVGILAVVVF